MKASATYSTKHNRTIIKKCHICGTLNESYIEVEKCFSCKKAFLPANYFAKVHAQNSEDFSKLFAKSDELTEDDLIKGVTVLW